MRIDVQQRMSNRQALAATGNSTDTLDLGNNKNAGVGEPMAVEIRVDVAPDDGANNETYQATLEADNDSAFGSKTEIASVNIPRTAKVGDRFVIFLPKTFDENFRYYRMAYALGGTTPSITVTAFLSPASMLEAWTTYRRGYDVGRVTP